MRVAVVGAGAWGSALSIHMARQHETLLWARDPQQAQCMQADRENRRYLPGIHFPSSLQVTSSLEHALDGCSLWVIACPMAGLRDCLRRMLPLRAIAQWPVVLWLCKGIERGSGMLAHQVIEQTVPGLKAAALSGPSFAQETAAGLPVALVVAGAHPECVVLARGLAEIARLGQSMGAQAQTFMGLTGLGDLLLTATGALSRNRQVGLALAQGESTAEILARLGHVAEGVSTAPVALELAARHGVDMPITEVVHHCLLGQIQAGEALQQLLARAGREEQDALDSHTRV
nr:glycerol-3-phosphate dehydrogenase [Betaproteobacteria bacterium]